MPYKVTFKLREDQVFVVDPISRQYEEFGATPDNTLVMEFFGMGEEGYIRVQGSYPFRIAVLPAPENVDLSQVTEYRSEGFVSRNEGAPLEGLTRQ